MLHFGLHTLPRHGFACMHPHICRHVTYCGVFLFAKAVVARRLAAKPCDQQSGCIIGCAKYIYENVPLAKSKRVMTVP